MQHWSIFSAASTQSSLNATDIINHVSAWIGVAEAVISLVVAVISWIVIKKGLEAIRELKKELRLKGLDAVCGFHAQLASNLKTLKQHCAVYGKESLKSGSSPENDESHKTAFLWFADMNTRTTLLARNDSFEETHFTVVRKCAENTIRLFNSSDGQLPLSPNMLHKFRSLYSELERFVYYDPCSPTNALSAGRIVVEHKKFISIINAIIKEIDKKTPKMLKGFWDEIDSLV
ncbi:MAG: hypothetical protein LBH28_06805 [Oscillospiraceae bacterium]|jgi:hypothetical protein|nr:hypothetical protein [Oscillospiraceae bacterium]